jgi:hypothetical protein
MTTYGDTYVAIQIRKTKENPDSQYRTRPTCLTSDSVLRSASPHVASVLDVQHTLIDSKGYDASRRQKTRIYVRTVPARRMPGS